MAKRESKANQTLSKKQLRFVQEFLVDLNATQAAIRAGYSKKTADVQGSRLLSKAKVKAKIEAGQKKLSEKIEITQERVLREYAKIAFLDPSTFFDKGGALLPIHDIPKESIAALSGIDIVKRSIQEGDDLPELEETKKIKVWDKVKALDSLARHLGLFEKDNDQKKPVNIILTDSDVTCL